MTRTTRPELTARTERYIALVSARANDLGWTVKRDNHTHGATIDITREDVAGRYYLSIYCYNGISGHADRRSVVWLRSGDVKARNLPIRSVFIYLATYGKKAIG